MSVLDGFMSTWSKARETFGQGTPQSGAQFDASAPLNQAASNLGSAAPGTRWTGGAASAYDTANTEHRRVLGQLAGLDQRLSAHVDQSSQVVATGRTNLDALRQWVSDAATAVPRGADRERTLLPIVHKGLDQLTAIVSQSTSDLNGIGAKIRGLGSEYQALGVQRFAPAKEGPDLQALEGEGDEDAGEDEHKSPAELGAEDSEALQNGELTPEQRERVAANTALTAKQQSALDNGSLTVPPEQMSYLQGFSRAFGDKTPADIKAVMDNAGPDGDRVADAFQLASNPNIKTGLPETQPPSVDAPASGGEYALPDGIQRVLDGPALTQPFTEGAFHEGRWIVPPEPTGPLQPTTGLNDLADIVQRGDRDLQVGSALDSSLMTKSQEMLAQSNQLPISALMARRFPISVRSERTSSSVRNRWKVSHRMSLFRALSRPSAIWPRCWRVRVLVTCRNSAISCRMASFPLRQTKPAIATTNVITMPSRHTWTRSDNPMQSMT